MDTTKKIASSCEVVLLVITSFGTLVATPTPTRSDVEQSLCQSEYIRTGHGDWLLAHLDESATMLDANNRRLRSDRTSGNGSRRVRGRRVSAEETELNVLVGGVMLGGECVDYPRDDGSSAEVVCPKGVFSHVIRTRNKNSDRAHSV